jgi:hypothetical protein
MKGVKKPRARRYNQSALESGAMPDAPSAESARCARRATLNNPAPGHR